MSYFIYTDLISSLLDPRLVEPGSTLIHVGAYDPRWRIRSTLAHRVVKTFHRITKVEHEKT